jgi:hypothetical protein
MDQVVGQALATFEKIRAARGRRTPVIEQRSAIAGAALAVTAMPKAAGAAVRG